MLIRRTPDTYEKMQALGGMASDDILSRPEGSGPARPADGPDADRLRSVTRRSSGVSWTAS